jgi:hypothetical protein
MGCVWIVEHRLRNPKWKRRREPCGRNGALLAIKGGKAAVELCARHRAIFREESHPSRTANLFEAEKRKSRRWFLASHLAMGGDIDPGDRGSYAAIVREIIEDFPELFTAPQPDERE